MGIAKPAFNYFDPDSLDKVPKTLSATGFFDNIATKQVTARAVPFEVNTPLWSDAAGKNCLNCCNRASKRLRRALS